jgi:hypothetical protein
VKEADMETESPRPHPVDLSPERRPGIPRETPPHPAVGAHWTLPERQVSEVEVLKRKELAELPPVFGTAAPPRGLSGVLRRIAYRQSETRVRHWLLLLFADRIDAIEHGRPWLVPAIALAVGLGLAARR